MKNIITGAIFLCALCILTGCATTGAGVNQALLFKYVPKVELPYRVAVEKNSNILEVGTAVDDSFSSDFMSMLGGVSGIAGVKATQATGIQSAMRGKFLAGEAFESAIRNISFIGNNFSPLIRFKLIRFQPLFKLYSGGRKFIVLMEFTSIFIDTTKSVKSVYIFEYTISTMEFFSSSKEKDILREIVEYALAHWANEMSAESVKSKMMLDFPEPVEGKLNFGRLECHYNIFVRLEN